ncbi:hypothetical protein HY522_09555 [bacterium]|nr:hypothetical protein [bacterium]
MEVDGVSSGGLGGLPVEETALLTGIIRKFESGIPEGHLHTLIYVCQCAGLITRRYVFQVRADVPYSEELDLSIAMLLWHNAIQIRRNRIFTDLHAPAFPALSGGSLDKLLSLSYDDLKGLAVGHHSGRDAVAQEVRQDGQ